MSTAASIFLIIWRNRHWLVRLARYFEFLARYGLSTAQIRKRLADGIQKGDIVSTDALEKARLTAANVKDYIHGKD